MANEVSKEQAIAFLSIVPKERLFWCSNGMTFSSLEELSKSLSKVVRGDFAHHVNAEKNDFATWIYDVIGDVSLATELMKTTKKTDITKKIKERVAQLKEIAA